LAEYQITLEDDNGAVVKMTMEPDNVAVVLKGTGFSPYEKNRKTHGL
jgi:hypothetical protein